MYSLHTYVAYTSYYMSLPYPPWGHGEFGQIEPTSCITEWSRSGQYKSPLTLSGQNFHIFKAMVRIQPLML
jgi:hypothetical protein